MSTDSSRALARAIGELGLEAEPQDVEDYLRLVQATAEMETAARTMLGQAVTSARSAGATWSAIGRTLGMTKQAAQQRFAVAPAVSAADLDPDERILGPVSAFDEMDELALAGQYGWHSVEFGPYYHRVVRSRTQWQHRRVPMLFAKARATEGDGWELIGSAFPFSYFKRSLGIPALEEPAQP